MTSKDRYQYSHEVICTGNCTPMAYNYVMIIIETSIFTRRIKDLMSDDEYRVFQEALTVRPDMGALIQGAGGLRKVRWRLEGTGKSGGVRAIYYWLTENDQLLMLYVYPKSERENLTEEQKRVLRQVVERWSDEK